jgi:N-acylneuraminate cytidylyltransferase
VKSSIKNKLKAKSQSPIANSELPKANSEQPTAKNLCIIPARGGSKRIPRKNIRDFLGKPILAYSIEAALTSNLFEEVMVSTDDKEIADVAKKYNAKVPFLRSQNASDDFATTLDVVNEVMHLYQNKGKEFDNICILYPTAPFVTTERLTEGYKKLTNFDAAIPVTEFSFPVWRSFNLKQDRLSYQWPKYEKSRSQDLETLYHDAGQWYWIKTAAIKASLVTENTAAIVLRNLEVQDIDQEEDWRLAELKYEYLQSSK